MTADPLPQILAKEAAKRAKIASDRRRRRSIIIGGLLSAACAVLVGFGLEPHGSWGWKELAFLLSVTGWFISQRIVWSNV